MAGLNLQGARFSERDLDFVVFVVEEAAPEVKDKRRLKHLIREDEDFWAP